MPAPPIVSADLDPLIAGLEPIDLVSTNAAALQERVDTKYVVTRQALCEALSASLPHYRVLEIGQIRVHPYRTVYFDTADLDLYRQHHAGRPHRFKIRSRQYLSTGQSFLEIKQKTPNNRTKKVRFQTDALLMQLCAMARRFVEDNVRIDAGRLTPSLSNAFSRITLVGKDGAERLTLDFDIGFALRDGSTSQARLLPGIVVAEVKQAGVDRGSPFIRQMRQMGVRQLSFSKYCVGISMHCPGVKCNLFKRQLEMLRRLTEQEASGGDLPLPCRKALLHA